jgi:peptide/nickel transport system substrate-binding protein
VVHRLSWLLAIVAVLSVACASPAGAPRSTGSGDQSGQRAQPAGPTRTLVMANRSEPPSVSAKRLETSSVTWGTTMRLFNAYLTLIDNRGAPQPYLAEALPQLNTDTWRVSPDGRMETIFRLREGLTWHDGAPLTADDFVFSWRVYATPQFGFVAVPPDSLMEDVSAPDPRTLRIQWKASYADADRLMREYPPLPRHILAEPFRQASESGQLESFVNHPYWNVEYVGAGPFKVERWEPGTYIEGSAFAGHALGKPKIDRIRLQFMTDANAVLASLLAGELHLAIDDSIRFQQGIVLRREWAPRNTGSLVINPTQWRYTYAQLNPDLARPRTLTDVRVRRALAHTIDKQGLNEGLFEGEGMMTDTMIPPMAPYFAAVDRAIAKYPYDVRRAEQLMAEAGYTKGADGTFTHPSEGRFASEVKILASPHNNTESAIMAAGWRQAGFDVQEAAFTAAQGSDAQARATFPGMHTTSASTLGEGQLVINHSSQIPTAQRGWRGSNRSGWSNPEYDRLFDTFNTTLDRERRNELVVDMTRVYSEDVPGFSLYFGLAVLAHVAGLQGPGEVVPETDVSWDIHRWDWR